MDKIDRGQYSVVRRMFITGLLLLLPAFSRGWVCGLRYDDRSSTVVPWADLLPIDTHISMCNISYTNSNQPSDIQAVGFATSAFCFGVCTGQDEFCKPQAVADVTETVSIECPGFTREFEMTRVGGCECAASSGSSGPYTPPECYKRSDAGPPAHLSLYMNWCTTIGPHPATHDACHIGTGCPAETPECLPENPVHNVVSFQCPVFNQERVCTDGYLGIMCPPGTRIQVLEAIYGAWEPFMTCPDAGGVDPDCQNATETTPVVQDLCNGKETCLYTVVNDGTLGADLCPNVSKHLRTEYFCTTVLSVVACVGTYMTLSCPANMPITVTKATYGRPYPEPTCPPGGSGEPASPCAVDVTNHMRTICLGNTTCAELVDFAFDPCPGLNSFLEMEYICSPIVSWWTIDSTLTPPSTTTVDVDYDNFDTCDCQ